MVATHDPSDEPFFREWNTHKHLTRSRTRSTQLQHALGLTRTLPIPAILIIGSKGKGTAVATATSALAKNATVGTTTSPPLRHNRERIRIKCRAISHTEYARLSEIAHNAIQTLPPVTDGYLPPSGIYTQVDIAYLLQQHVDYLVIEEGLGGLSDDVSLFDYPTIGITGKNICEQLPTREQWESLSRVLEFDLPYEDISITFNAEMGLTDVWTDIEFYQKGVKRIHPTQKSLTLIERLIRASSNVGDVVLEKFFESAHRKGQIIKEISDLVYRELRHQDEKGRQPEDDGEDDVDQE